MNSPRLKSTGLQPAKTLADVIADVEEDEAEAVVSVEKQRLALTCMFDMINRPGQLRASGVGFSEMPAGLVRVRQDLMRLHEMQVHSIDMANGSSRVSLS